MDYALFVSIALASSVISAVFGLGTALLLITLGSYILPVRETIALATIMFTAGTFARTLLYRRHIDWHLTMLITVFSVPFASLGALALAVTPTDLLKTSLGIMALIYVAMALSGWTPKVQIGTVALMFGSAIYGFVSGLLGTGNVVKAMVFDHMGLRKEAFVGLMAATSVVANVVKISLYASNSLITHAHILPGVGLAGCALIGTFAGRVLLKRVAPEHFRIGFLVVLAMISLGLVFG